MKYNHAKANAEGQKEQRKMLRNKGTAAEATLWKLLKGRGAGGYKFRRQQGIGPYILDFFCPELSVCVEIDGSSHDYKYEYDEQRTSYLQQHGIRVIRFTNEQIWANPQWVADEIVRLAKGNDL